MKRLCVNPWTDFNNSKLKHEWMESFKARVISPLDVKSSHEVRLQQELVEAKRELQSMASVGRKFRKSNKGAIKKRIKK